MDGLTGSEKLPPRMNFVIPLVQRPRILKAAELLKEYGKFKGKEKKSAEAKAILHKLDPVLFTPEELKLLEVGVSQQSYHYWGLTRFHARAGKAIA